MSLASDRVAGRASAAAPAGLLGWLAPNYPWVILGYFALHVVMRVAISPAVDLDEAEQIMLTQELRWGYGSQPPLYTWLQHAVFALTGTGVLGLSLLKNALLALAYLALFGAVRRMTGSAATAAVASLSLLLLPQVAWDAQRDLSHSVLVVTLSAATLWALVRLVQERRTVDYVAFGAALGLGLIAKYNFALLMVALLAGALLHPWARAALLDRRTGLALLVMLAIVAGPIVWVLGNESVATGSSWKLYKGEGIQVFGLEVGGLYDLLRRFIDAAGIQLAVMTAWLWRPKAKVAGPAPKPWQAWRDLVGASLVAGFGVIAAGVVAFEISNLSERWLLPLAVLLGPFLVLAFRAEPTGRRAAGVAWTAIACAGIVVLLVPGRVLLGPAIGDPTRLNVPVPALAEQIRGLGFERGTIASSKQYVAADLKLAFPDSVAVYTEKSHLAPAVLPACWLLAYDAADGAELHDSLRTLYLERTGISLEARTPVFVEAPRSFGDGSDPFRLGVVIPDPTACADLPPGSSNQSR